MKFTIVDNGDDQVTVKCKQSSAQCCLVHLSDTKYLDISCNMFKPALEESKVMIAGSGTASYLKSVKITVVKREDKILGSQLKSRECCISTPWQSPP